MDNRLEWAFCVGIGIVGLWLIIIGFVLEARAHEAPTGWTYPLQCCSNRDCVMLDSERVKEGPDGFRVTLFPGDHDFIKQQTSFLVEYQTAKPSPDGAYHICINEAMKVLCFFAGPRGS